MFQWSYEYAIFFALGAVIAGVHAYELYAEPAPGKRLLASELLASANLIALSGQRAYFRGFLWYLVITETAYVVLATSGTVLTLATEVAGVPAKNVGALSAAQGIASPNSLLPIAAASLLTTMVRVKPFSELESLLRRASHYLAGIPGTTYLIAEAVDDFDVHAAATGSVRSIVQVQAARQAASAGEKAVSRGLDPAAVEDLKSSIERLHVYRNWIFGSQDRQFWPQRCRDVLRVQFDSLAARLKDFDIQLEAQLAGGAGMKSGAPDLATDWAAWHSDIRKLERECRALLTLLLINGSPLPRVDREPALKALAEHARTATDNREFNAVAGAVVKGTAWCSLLALVLTMAFELSVEWTGSVWTDPSSPAGRTDWHRLFASGVIGSISRDAIWRAFEYSLLIGGATAIGLSLRAARVADGSWRGVGDHNWSPFLGYFKILAMAGICVVPLYLILQYLQLVVIPAAGPDLNENLPPLWHDFSVKISGLMLKAIVGLVAVWLTCVITDREAKHADLARHEKQAERTLQEKSMEPASSGDGPDSSDAKTRLRRNLKYWQSARERLKKRSRRDFIGLLVLAGLLTFIVEWLAETWIEENLAVQAVDYSKPGEAALWSLAQVASFAKEFMLPVVSIVVFGFLYRGIHRRGKPSRKRPIGPAITEATPKFAAVVVLLAIGLPAFAAPSVAKQGAIQHESAPVLRVGVRADAHPFSFRKERERPATDLRGYDGFSVHVCREMLEDLRHGGLLQDVAIEAVEVAAGSRFDMLSRGAVDMLCGPDSIDQSRMQSVNASLPIFLSGITYAYRREFPRRRYCGPVLGVVRDTTAHRFGLKAMADKKILKRFHPELEQHLLQTTRPPEPICSSAMAGIPCRVVTTSNCEEGYPEDPIRIFDSHSDAVEALCRERDFLLYYVGDVDLIRSKIEDYAQRYRCNVRLEPHTLSREVYAILFRRQNEISAAALARDTARGFSDAQLYAEFNNALLQSIQSPNTVLERSFSRAFPGAQMSRDLEEFFRILKITRGWKE